MYIYMRVMGVLKMGNIVPKAGNLTHISGIPGQSAIITPHTITPSWCHHYTHTYLYVQLLASEVSADYYICIYI